MTAIIISGISLVISIWAIFEAKKARLLNYRSIKADKLDRYGAELYEIRNSTREDLEELSCKAWAAYEQAGKYLDRYSGAVTGGRPARHILFDFCFGFWEQYSRKIGKTGPFIWFEFEKILRIDNSPDDLKDYFKVLSSYETLCAAIPESDRQMVFDAIFAFSENYRTLHLEIYDRLKEKSKKIDTLIDRNEHEEFKVYESASGKKLISENLKYKELLNLGLDDVKGFTESSRMKPDGWQLIETLYTLVILYFVGEYDKWGGVEESA